jgi:hypothetical protein
LQNIFMGFSHKKRDRRPVGPGIRAPATTERISAGDRLEERVMNALRHHLMDPTLFKEFCDEFTREMNRLRMAGHQSMRHKARPSGSTGDWTS